MALERLPEPPPEPPPTDGPPPIDAAAVMRALPGLARIASASAWRVAEWGAATSLATSAEMLKAVAAGESPTRILQETTSELRRAAREALGLIEVGDPVDDVEPPDARATTSEELRARGAELLHRSAGVGQSDEIHPAYGRILDELAPDEARILKLLALDGAQPSVDVRSGRPLGMGSALVASGLSMIGLQSGVREIDRTDAYLNNLYRLGLIWFSHEPLPDPARYQVVEVQPEVAEALRQGGRGAKTVRRSIVLTPFGRNFCRVCFPFEATDAVSGGASGLRPAGQTPA